MRNPHGYSTWTDVDTGEVLRERDTVQCCHCQSHILVKPNSVATVYLIADPQQLNGYREEPGAWCGRCQGPVCLRCHDVGVCTPFMRLIEEAEAKQRQLNQILGVS